MLEVAGLSAAYGHVNVLEDVSLDVRAGECVTVIGANGSGKSTLLKTVAGLIRPTAGRVSLDGEDATGLAAEKLVRRGVALVPEGRRLFGPMSVAENLELGAYARGRVALGEDLERVRALFPVLGERASQPAATLSGGEQQMLAIARALMSRPRLLLLDEPSLGLAPKVIASIFAALDELRSGGLTILLVEQDARVALRHADRGYVMRTGRVVLSGPAAQLAQNDDVRLIYLGGRHGRGIG
ncbi:MAG TPA: ABC transporter ATP-binding protein [Coriobacteriia bacterium]|jgi:branched-chain amino acid transport system ATP-binding protein